MQVSIIEFADAEQDAQSTTSFQIRAVDVHKR